jgi:hypothetical protein
MAWFDSMCGNEAAQTLSTNMSDCMSDPHVVVLRDRQPRRIRVVREDQLDLRDEERAQRGVVVADLAVRVGVAVRPELRRAASSLLKGQAAPTVMLVRTHMRRRYKQARASGSVRDGC